jgi:subtilisin family serine protease
MPSQRAGETPATLFLRAVLLVAALCVAASPASAIVGWDPSTGVVSIVNVDVGADRFYSAGYYGFNTLIANVEAGHVWPLHETLGNVTLFVNDPSIGPVSRLYDYHATMVGFELVGLGPYEPNVGYYYSQFGMAPGAALVSTAIATAWDGNSGAFEISTQTFVYGYQTVMQTGVQIPLAPGISFTRTADVINSSWGFDDPAGAAQYTRILDALAYANHQTVVLAAGNHDGNGPAPVIGPASGYNSISVAALGTVNSTPAYSSPASFSNYGPNDFYNPQTGVTVPGVRCGVDIAAPGTDMFLAAYTGTTGTNPLGTDPAPGATDLYWVGAAGTSMAAPVVAGGAALVVDAGYANFGGGQAVDGRVIKAVLLNSARKTAGWTNNMTLAGGVYGTTQALDYSVGAGMLDLNRAYDQYLSGSANATGLGGGTVSPLGWAYGRVSKGTPNDYFISQPLHAGEVFTATLAWFVNTSLDANTQVASDVSFDELDLQLWRVAGGILSTLVAESRDPYDAEQHIYFGITTDDSYAIQVLWEGKIYDIPGDTPATDDYGLAWSAEFPGPDTVLPSNVPEPASAVILAAGLLLVGRRRGAIRIR